VEDAQAIQALAQDALALLLEGGEPHRHPITERLVPLCE
jgi:hypothetical protein